VALSSFIKRYLKKDQTGLAGSSWLVRVGIQKQVYHQAESACWHCVRICIKKFAKQNKKEKQLSRCVACASDGAGLQCLGTK